MIAPGENGMFSHNITARERTTRLPATSRFRRPHDRRSLSRSATRALDVLEYFGVAQRPLRAVEIAQALGLQASTTDQLLKTMVDSAHLVFDARAKLYSPSPRLIRFGLWLAQNYSGDDRIRRMLEEVHAASGLTVTLDVQHDLFMQIIDVIQLANAPAFTERGIKVPLFGSAIGGAFLASREDGEIEALMERARLPPADRPPLLESLHEIRREGHAFSGVSAEGDIWSVAVALPPMPAGVPMVVGLAGTPERIRTERAQLAELLHEAIRRHLG
jgi:DNA-binding IclR family transcriptional regulator